MYDDIIMDNQGLNPSEAALRLKKFGRNELKAPQEFKAVKIFISQFTSPLIYILVIASGVTWFIGDMVDAAVIAAAVGLNTLLGFFQEFKAERGLQALNKILTPRAKVIRDSERQIIDAAEVVPGDICVLEVGERVPADGILAETDSLIVNEAVLTGESTPVNKAKNDAVYMGTTIAGGIAKMKTEATGAGTKFGQIAASLKETKEELTPLQIKLKNFSQKLTWILGAICLAIFILGLWRGIKLTEIFTTSVAVAVSAIPEGLVIALTVILSLGMRRILKRKALVRKLVAAETLGSVTVICCDKTGTLTEGKMKVVKAITDDEPLMEKAAILCNDQRDPLEISMLEWAQSIDGEDTKNFPRLDEIPFNHEKKYIATLHPGLLLVSGAPEVVLAKCKNPDFKEKTLIDEAKKGHRIVSFAYKKFNGKRITDADIKDLTWLGILVYADPVRQGVKEVLDQARKEGIKIKLITGDYKETALAVGAKLGFKPQDIYSRVAPEEKLKIVRELQEKGEVVAMTGDGVNDAPALKKADIGIVVADASAVATETADMVLLDSNFATILAAVEEGRLIFSNLVKVLYYLMSHAFAEVVVISGSIVLNLPLPLTAAQILWINLINDSWPAFALILDPKDGRPAKRELFDRRTKWSVALISGLIGILALTLFYFSGSRSLAFSLVATAPLIFSFAIGSIKNLYLVAAALAGFGLQILVLYFAPFQQIFETAPLHLSDWLIILAAGAAIAGIMKLTAYDRR